MLDHCLNVPKASPSPYLRQTPGSHFEVSLKFLESWPALTRAGSPGSGGAAGRLLRYPPVLHRTSDTEALNPFPSQETVPTRTPLHLNPLRLDLMLVRALNCFHQWHPRANKLPHISEFSPAGNGVCWTVCHLPLVFQEAVALRRKGTWLRSLSSTTSDAWQPVTLATSGSMTFILLL